MKRVLDASALLAFLNQEPGGASILELMDGALISAVNWAEVAQKSLQRGVNTKGMLADVSDLGLQIIPFSASQAELAAQLWPQTRQHGLSLADRSCLALGMENSATVYTADRIWAKLELGIAINLLR